MDSDFPWIYVAMIFIAFVSWIRSRLQDAAELRRASAARKDASRKTTKPANQTLPASPYLHGPSAGNRSKPPIQEPASLEAPIPEMPKTFRELFEVLQEQVAGPAEPPANRQPAPPPPLPATAAPRVVAPVAAPRQNPTSSPAASRPPVPTGSHRARKIARKTSGDLNRILKTRGTLREALILKEILDVPVSLKD